MTRNRLSSAEFNFNLTVDSKIQLKKQVSEFIQILSNTPELSIVHEADIKINFIQPKR